MASRREQKSSRCCSDASCECVLLSPSYLRFKGFLGPGAKLDSEGSISVGVSQAVEGRRAAVGIRVASSRRVLIVVCCPGECVPPGPCFSPCRRHSLPPPQAAVVAGAVSLLSRDVTRSHAHLPHLGGHGSKDEARQSAGCGLIIQ